MTVPLWIGEKKNPSHRLFIRTFRYLLSSLSLGQNESRTSQSGTPWGEHRSCGRHRSKTGKPLLRLLNADQSFGHETNRAAAFREEAGRGHSATILSRVRDDKERMAGRGLHIPGPIILLPGLRRRHGLYLQRSASGLLARRTSCDKVTAAGRQATLGSPRATGRNERRARCARHRRSDRSVGLQHDTE